jgi:hypothetical protein
LLSWNITSIAQPYCLGCAPFFGPGEMRVSDKFSI